MPVRPVNLGAKRERILEELCSIQVGKQAGLVAQVVANRLTKGQPNGSRRPSSPEGEHLSAKHNVSRAGVKPGVCRADRSLPEQDPGADRLSDPH